MQSLHFSGSKLSIGLSFILSILAFRSSTAIAQAYTPAPNDTLQSVTIAPDFRIIFRIYAPHAADVKLGGTDIPEGLRKDKMTKLANGVWEVTVGPVRPGAYRYNFVVDDVPVIDPRNPSVSESNMNAWSLVYVPGSSIFDTKDVPHGAISQVAYYSKALKKFRRMHIYTPPGYESGSEKYPVFYLLHGAFDTDDAWPSVGRAGFILDNLIAGKKAVPMVVVMPAGHTGPFTFNPSTGFRMGEFVDDFLQDIVPYAESHYRILRDREDRAIAGLSMGGAQTLDIAISSPANFSYVGVYSSGILGRGPTDLQTWEEKHKNILDDPDLKKGLRVFWFATGKEDFLLGVSHGTVEMFKRHGFNVVYNETSGGHTWMNWREYLAEFAPLLFK
jgi:enterochelin esterase family protein